jgi:hypothetical protein
VALILNIGTSNGNLYPQTWWVILKLIPPIWVIAMLLETFLVGPFSHKMVECFTESTDGFNTRIVFNIIFCVFGMSAIMTLIGPMFGGEFLGALKAWPHHWPRNFGIMFWCELLFAQPVARQIMKKMHLNQMMKKKEKGALANYER